MKYRPTTIPTLLFNVLAGLGVALIFLATIELLIRLALPFPLTSITTYQAFPDVTYFHKPNSIGYEVSPVKEYRPVRLEYDENGFRRTGSKTPGPGDVIVLLGDSFVESRQVEADQTAAGLLAARFSNKQIINAGCSAYTTTTEYLLLKHRIIMQKPKQIFLFFSFNDYADNYWYYGGYYKQKNIFETGLPDASYIPVAFKEHFDKFENWLAVNFALYGYTKHLTRPAYKPQVWKEVAESKRFNDSPRNINKKSTEMDDLETEVLNFTHQGILAINSLAKANGAKLTVMIIPIPPQINKDEWRNGKMTFGYADDDEIVSRVYQDRISEFLMANGIECVDLLPEFKNGALNGSIYLDFDGHWSPYGNRVVANLLIPRILQRQGPQSD